MKQTEVTNAPVSNEPSNRIQVVFSRPANPKQPETLAERVRTSASANLVAAFDELEKMIGLQQAKKVIYEIYALARVNDERVKHKLKTDQQIYHMVFKGNPGTGKTTVARIFGKILKEMGILSKGHLIEVERADLVGEFIGHTAQKTRELIKKALGGVLFIDEAYSLARGGEKDFGKEAIDCLTKSLEDSGREYVCILAGYPDEMDTFLELNPGLPSRFPIQLFFDDYSIDELMQISDQLAANKEYVLSKHAREKMKLHVSKVMSDPFRENFSNARYVRNAIEKAIRIQATRLLANQTLTRDELQLLLPEDFQFDLT